MTKRFISALLTTLGIVCFGLIFGATPAQARNKCSDSAFGYTYSPSFQGKYYSELDYPTTITISGFEEGNYGTYKLRSLHYFTGGAEGRCDDIPFTVSGSTATVTIGYGDYCYFDGDGDYGVELISPDDAKCDLAEFEIRPGHGRELNLDLNVTQVDDNETNPRQYCIDNDSEVVFHISNVRYDAPASTVDGEPYTGWLRVEVAGGGGDNDRSVYIDDGEFNAPEEHRETYSVPIDIDVGEDFWLEIYKGERNSRADGVGDDDVIEEYKSTLTDQCTPEEEEEAEDDHETQQETGTHSDFELCEQIPASSRSARDDCFDCFRGVGKFGSVERGVWTAIGCIDRDPTQIIQTIIKVGLSISGGVAMLMILGAGFMFSTSQGDPKRTSEAKELLTSAIVGLLFIIFSITILQFIGVSILQIPGFGT